MFNPRLIISEHFDKAKNELDIQTEKLLVLSQNDLCLYNSLNELRKNQIEVLETIKQANLNLNKDDQETLESKWKNLIDDRHLNFELKADQIKADLIKVDCFMVRDESFDSKMSLWITRWYNNNENLIF